MTKAVSSLLVPARGSGTRNVLVVLQEELECEEDVVTLPLRADVVLESPLGPATATIASVVTLFVDGERVVHSNGLGTEEVSISALLPVAGIGIEGGAMILTCIKENQKIRCLGKFFLEK